MVKTEVIANYLKAEVEAAKGPSDVALTPQNYKFKFKGTQDWNGRQVYVLHVNPREKKVGLFKGELWLDAETYMPVRESGSFVKSPSFMLKKMQFVRDYELQNGVSIPQRTESRVETRFFGKVELNINYLTFSKDSPQAGVALTMPKRWWIAERANSNSRRFDPIKWHFSRNNRPRVVVCCC